MPPTKIRPGDRRPSQEPPPSPIANGKGLRSAAVYDEILSDYLQTSLKVPNLTLPRAYSTTNITAEIDLYDIATGDSAAVRCIVAAAAEAGCFRINGADMVTYEEVNAAVEAGALVFDSMAARRRGLVSRFGIGEEICWRRWKRKEMEPLLEDVPPETYRAFRYGSVPGDEDSRERMEVMAAKLEMVADCISYILCEKVGGETHSHRPPKMQSVLYLRKHRRHRLDDIAIEHINGRSDDKARFLISIHIPVLDHYMFCTHSSALSSSFDLPAGSILVTIGEQLKEWCNGEYRTSVGEMLLNPIPSLNPLFSMEFIMYSLPDSDSDHHPIVRNKIISVMDQFLVFFLIVFFFNMWFCSYLF